MSQSIFSIVSRAIRSLRSYEVQIERGGKDAWSLGSLLGASPFKQVGLPGQQLQHDFDRLQELVRWNKCVRHDKSLYNEGLTVPSQAVR